MLSTYGVAKEARPQLSSLNKALLPKPCLLLQGELVGLSNCVVALLQNEAIQHHENDVGQKPRAASAMEADPLYGVRDFDCHLPMKGETRQGSRRTREVQGSGSEGREGNVRREQRGGRWRPPLLDVRNFEFEYDTVTRLWMRKLSKQAEVIGGKL